MTESTTSLRHSYLIKQPEYSNTSSRLEFLYSSFSSRKNSNLTGFNSALTWWRLNLLTLVSKGLLGEHKLLLVADDDLRENLRWPKLGRPSSLGIIISELASTSDYIPLNSYLTSTNLASGTQNNSSWISLLAKPLWWSLSHVKTRILGTSELIGETAEEVQWRANEGEWVIQELVERTAVESIPKLNELHFDTLSRLYTLKSFHSTLNTLSDSPYSERDALVLAKHLSNKGLCVLQGEAIKFLPQTKLITPPSSSTYRITDADLGILTLLSTLSSLASYITALEARIISEQSLVSNYYAAKQITMVKSHLMNRKRLEVLLNERVGSQTKLSEVLSSIERAKGDEEALEALQLGTQTLRTILSSPTLSLSNVQETTDRMQETLTDAEEIDRAIQEVGEMRLEGGKKEEEDEEVERELKELVEEEDRKEKMEREMVEKEKRELEEKEKGRKVEEELERVMMAEMALLKIQVPVDLGAEAEVEKEKKSEEEVAEKEKEESRVLLPA